MKRNFVLLGSTGSIGTQALDVAEQGGHRVLAVSANVNVNLCEMQARKFSVKAAAMMDESAAKELKIRLADTDIKVYSGMDGICELARIEEADVVLNSVVGIAGLKPTLAAIDAGKDIALANKETLVTGGELVMKKAKERSAKILPVDSEHSAIFQCLQSVPEGALNRILLTASGGPFYGRKFDSLKDVTPAEALRHPNWSMGSKISIDSATLMNKGLEVIEAVHLFGVSSEDIEVLVHRQSIVHSAVELCDGAVIAQLGTADMHLPIQYALTYPERSELCFGRLSLSDIGTLTFEKPDMETFRCLDICINAIRSGGLKPAAANGANEEAVRLFLEEKIKFLQIAELVEAATYAQPATAPCSVEDIIYADIQARELVRSRV